MVRLVEGGLTVVGGGPRKGRKLLSFLEGLAFSWPWAMIEESVLPEKVWALWESLVKAVVRVWWYACFTLERRVVQKAEARPTDVGKEESCRGAAKAMEVDLGLWRWVGQGLG